jgi:hypothetical protein
MNLGTALRTLGSQESGTARLEEAVTAYRAALEEMTRERVPLQWANSRIADDRFGCRSYTLCCRARRSIQTFETLSGHRIVESPATES